MKPVILKRTIKQCRLIYWLAILWKKSGFLKLEEGSGSESGMASKWKVESESRSGSTSKRCRSKPLPAWVPGTLDLLSSLVAVILNSVRCQNVTNVNVTFLDPPWSSVLLRSGGWSAAPARLWAGRSWTALGYSPHWGVPCLSDAVAQPRKGCKVFT